MASAETIAMQRFYADCGKFEAMAASLPVLHSGVLCAKTPPLHCTSANCEPPPQTPEPAPRSPATVARSGWIGGLENRHLTVEQRRFLTGVHTRRFAHSAGKKSRCQRVRQTHAVQLLHRTSSPWHPHFRRCAARFPRGTVRWTPSQSVLMVAGGLRRGSVGGAANCRPSPWGCSDELVSAERESALPRTGCAADSVTPGHELPGTS